MGRDSKAVMFARQQDLSQKMAEGLDYSTCLMWYTNTYGKSEGMFQKDRTAIYKRWKTEIMKNSEEDLVELLKNIESDRKLARDTFNPSAAIQADKLIAQLKGLLNKQGEVIVATQVNNIVGITPEILEAIRKTPTDGLRKLIDSFESK